MHYALRCAEQVGGLQGAGFRGTGTASLQLGYEKERTKTSNFPDAPMSTSSLERGNQSKLQALPGTSLGSSFPRRLPMAGQEFFCHLGAQLQI